MAERFVYDTGIRSQAQPDGSVRMVHLAWCACPTPKGPPGGVCGICGGAIYQPPAGERAVEPAKDEA
jgi:hypothetical protein